MANLPCYKCGKRTNTYGSWDAPIKIICVECIDKQALGENNE